MTERLLQHGFDDTYGPGAVNVRSAGTRAMVGHEMDARSAAMLTELGGDPSGFRARRLTSDMVGEASLVLGASREHRAAAVTHYPRALRHTFTLRELAALLRGADTSSLPAEPGDRLPAVAELARSRRAHVVGPQGQEWDVVDPFRQTDEVYATTRRQLTDALADLAPTLGLRWS